MTTILERENIKTILKVMAKEEPAVLKEILEEINIVEEISINPRLKEIVEEDFKEYADVLKALA